MTSNKRRVLFIGDAVVSSGFARLNHAYIAGLVAADWDVHVLALNYMGEPHTLGVPVYPCYTYGGGDAFGLKRTKELVERLRPDVVCLTNDPWNIPAYMTRIGNTPVVASIAVDGLNCRGAGLNGLAHAIFWTEFGLVEAKKGGYTGTASVLPLGVDLETYKPYPKSQIRTQLGLGRLNDAFIVGVVGRNQPRKRLDLALIYFAEWIRSHDVRDAYLFLHVGPTGDAGYDIEQLGRYLGIANRLIVVHPEIGHGVPEASLAQIYSAFDIMLTTTQGEGWGLTHMEGMACGIPQIVPDWAALGEWASPAAWLVECSSVACTPNEINVIGGVADRGMTIAALHHLYTDRKERERLSGSGLELVLAERYRWDSIGARFVSIVEEALTPKRLAVDVEVSA